VSFSIIFGVLKTLEACVTMVIKVTSTPYITLVYLMEQVWE
jgi:hypothetical protein